MAVNGYTSGEGASANLFNQSLYEADYGKSSQEMSTAEKKELANDPTINLPEFMELAKNSPEKKAFIDFLEKTDGTFVQNEESKGGSGRIVEQRWNGGEFWVKVQGLTISYGGTESHHDEATRRRQATLNRQGTSTKRGTTVTMQKAKKSFTVYDSDEIEKLKKKIAKL